MAERLYRLRPHARRVVWAGDHLDALLGLDREDGWGVGEALDASALPGMSSTIEGGRHDGRRLAEVFAEDPAAFLGDGQADAVFPLLVKRLDTGDVLSVQVHPDRAQALRLEGRPEGKSEAWVVLAAEPDAAVWAGLADGVTRAQLVAALDGGDPMALLRRIAVQEGDVVPVPAGTVHAIGPGLLILEVQEPSDVTYRLHDHDRRDAEGRGRALHLDKALDVLRDEARVEKARPRRLEAEGGERELLCALEAFSIERWTTAGVLEVPVDRLMVLQGLEGEAIVAVEDERTRLSPGETVVVSARAGGLRIAAETPVTLICAAAPVR